VIFLRQLIAQARPEDVAIGISPAAARATSSWRWKKRANAVLLTVALLGYDGGEIKRRAWLTFPWW
jgi:D-sedoheptulose 7-phosphate isomerase